MEEKQVQFATYMLGDKVRLHSSYGSTWVVIGKGLMTMANGGDDIPHYVLQSGTNQAIVPIYAIEKLVD
jgi:hypothetical protein